MDSPTHTSEDSDDRYMMTSAIPATVKRGRHREVSVPSGSSKRASSAPVLVTPKTPAAVAGGAGPTPVSFGQRVGDAAKAAAGIATTVIATHLFDHYTGRK